jgi:hypothetical protein
MFDSLRVKVDLTSGDLPFVLYSGLRAKRFVMTGRQKPAAGLVGMEVPKAQTVSARN